MFPVTLGIGNDLIRAHVHFRVAHAEESLESRNAVFFQTVLRLIFHVKIAVVEHFTDIVLHEKFGVLFFLGFVIDEIIVHLVFRSAL